MCLGFKVSGRIAKSIHEVFDAVVNPKKLSGYFTTLNGASAPLVTGTTVTWWGSVPVEVDEIELDKRIVLPWDAAVAEGQPAYKTRIEMGFDVLEDVVGRKASYSNCEGWAEMLSAMKAWLEYDINLREGFYPSEMRGQLPTTSERK